MAQMPRIQCWITALMGHRPKILFSSLFYTAYSIINRPSCNRHTKIKIQLRFILPPVMLSAWANYFFILYLVTNFQIFTATAHIYSFFACLTQTHMPTHACAHTHAHKGIKHHNNHMNLYNNKNFIQQRPTPNSELVRPVISSYNMKYTNVTI